MRLVTDKELMDYVEGILTASERKDILQKLRENDQMDLLYHLQQSYAQTMKDYADELLGEDECEIGKSYDLGETITIAAKHKKRDE